MSVLTAGQVKIKKNTHTNKWTQENVFKTVHETGG